MNIQHLQSILSIDAPDEIKKEMIYSELSKDEDVLLHFVKILRYERDRKQACMFDMQTIISDLDIIHT